MPPKKSELDQIVQSIHIINQRLDHLESSKSGGAITNNPIMVLKYKLQEIVNRRDDLIDQITEIMAKMKHETNKRTLHLFNKELTELENEVQELMQYYKTIQDEYLSLVGVHSRKKGGDFGSFMADVGDFWMNKGRHVIADKIEIEGIPVGKIANFLTDKVVDWTNAYAKEANNGKTLYSVSDFLKESENPRTVLSKPTISDLSKNVIDEIVKPVIGGGVSTGKRGRPKKGAKIGLLGTTESSKPPKHLREQAQKYMRPEDYV